MHVHVNAIDFIKFAAFMVIFAFIWKTTAMRLPEESTTRQAMLWLYN